MPLPSNLTALTAIDLGALPASVAQVVDFEGVTHTVWFKYTAQPGDTTLSLFGFGDLAVYKPETWLFVGPASAPVPYLGGYSYYNVCVYFPVTPGVTYLFKFTPNPGNPTPAALSISLIRHVNRAAPVGSIAVNDDTQGFPLALLGATGPTVDVLRYVPAIAAGEQVAVLADGTMAIQQGLDEFTAIYDGAFNQIATRPTTGLITSNKVDAFYTYNFDTLAIERFNAAGVVTGTWQLAAPAGQYGDAIGVSPDETVLYYFTQAPTTIIRRWDLVNNVALPDLLSVPGRLVKDIVVLDTGALVVEDSSRDLLLRLDGVTGAVLQSFPLTSGLGDRLTRGLTEATVWLWNKQEPPNEEQDFKEIRLSDGAVLQSIHGMLFVSGGYDGTMTATPLARFGNSHSCPFWIMRSVVDGGDGTDPPDPPDPPDPGAECECCMATELDSWNNALGKLGVSQFVVDLDEVSKEAQLCKRWYPKALKETLRSHPWGFATKYAAATSAPVGGAMELVAGTETTPVNGDWRYAYRYPADCVMARRIVPPDGPALGAGRTFARTPIPWRVGRTTQFGEALDYPLIYTNQPDAVLEYTAYVACRVDFNDALFEDALSSRLAWKLAPALVRDKKTAIECLTLFKQAVSDAAVQDMREQQQEPDGEHAAWNEGR